MKLSRDEVLHIARLAKLGLTEAEVKKLGEQLSHILESFEVLKRVDTSGIPPTAQPNTLQNVLKSDEAKASLSQSQVLGLRNLSFLVLVLLLHGIIQRA